MSYNHKLKQMRVFTLQYGIPEGDYGTKVKIMARSSLEAGLIISLNDMVPEGRQAHFLIDSQEEA